MVKRPVIGLNMDVQRLQRLPYGRLWLHAAYADCVERAGGVPLILPPYLEIELFKETLPQLDGFCLIGGEDYTPALYGGRPQRTEELTHDRRSRFDWVLTKYLLEETTLPVFGVCGGQQLMSLVRGAGLVQDIRTEWPGIAGKPPLPHAGRERKDNMGYRHDVRVEPKTMLAQALGTDRIVSTNSHHHQAVHPDRVGECLVATAWTEDGMVEATEAAPGSDLAKDRRFVLGVQWHPERMPFDETQQALFRALVKAADGQ